VIVATPLRALLIDDNPVDRARIIQELEQGFGDSQIHQVSTRRELDRALEAGGFNLVLCDYLLPWTDGMAVFRVIRERWPRVPVIMVTGSGNEEIAIAAIKAGLDDYILKSHRHLARLSTSIRSALDRAEQRRQLEEAEARYQALFDRLPVGLFRAAPSGEFLDVNPALVDMLGYPNRESLMGARGADLYIHPADRGRWQEQAERDGLVRDVEAPFRRRDGSIAWLRINARLVRDADGRILWYEGSLEDVTARKRIEDALAERMRQLETMRAATEEIIRELDLTTLMHLVVRWGTELVGGTAGVVGLWDAAAQAIEPHAWCGRKELFRTGGWKLGEGLIGTVAARRHGMVVNGDTVSPAGPPDREHGGQAAAMVAEPLVSADRLLGIVAVATEERNRRFTESDRHILGLFAAQVAVAMDNARLFGELSQAKGEWENTFNAAADLIAVLDLDSRFLRVNQALAQRLRMQPQDVIGRRCEEVFEGCEGCRSGQCAFSRCVELRQSATEEREIPRTGEVFLQTYSPFLDAHGSLVGVVQISKDVTALRKLQQQLMHSDKMIALGRLVSGVAHEINNPLTAILGNAQLLQLDARDEVTRQRAKVLVSETERTAKIVRSLVTFARSQKPNRKPVQVNPLVEEALKLRASDWLLRNIAIERRLAPGLPPILADGPQIQQVLLGLLTNAEQAVVSRTGGVIGVETGADYPNGMVTVSVTDNGPGIPPEALGKIFDPFFTTREVGKGTGLGLAISYSIIHEHGGHLQARNRPQGGACFEFALPVIIDDAAPTPPSAEPTATTPEGKRRILVVDDEETIVRVLRDALRMEGHSVEVAGDGRQAVEMLGREDFDLVLMDMKMPGLDGERLYEDVIRRKSDPPRVVIMTGDTVNKNTWRFLERTGLRCFEKPFKLDDILECARDPKRLVPIGLDRRPSAVSPS
jgi:PAS domain S-box-containing protein